MPPAEPHISIVMEVTPFGTVNVCIVEVKMKEIDVEWTATKKLNNAITTFSAITINKKQIKSKSKMGLLFYTISSILTTVVTKTSHNIPNIL
jgi:hypothetical protein